MERDVMDDGPGQDGIRSVVLVERLEYNDLVTRIYEREQAGDHDPGHLVAVDD